MECKSCRTDQIRQEKTLFSLETCVLTRWVLSLLLWLAPSAAGAFEWRDRSHGLPHVIGERDPSDPGERVPRSTYRSVTEATKSFRPVAPLSWEEMNRRVMPRPKAEQPAKK